MREARKAKKMINGKPFFEIDYVRVYAAVEPAR
jgi:hypothetical protein